MEPYQQLESEFAKFVGVEPDRMVLCSSGTAALHLALEAFQLPLGSSRIVLPEFTMIACPRAVALAGHIPVFVDCKDNLNIDPSYLPQRSRNMRAVMAVHIYGRRADMDSIHEWATANNDEMEPAYVVEDLAEGHGIAPHPETDAACYSFYRNKIICGEEGGAVAFKNIEHARHARLLRSMGFTETHDFIHIPRSHNYRMSNAHAKLILDSLSQFQENSAKRRQVEEWYNGLIPITWQMPKRDVVWVYDFRLPPYAVEHQDNIIRKLNAQGIAARHSFKPMSRQPEFSGPYQHLNAHRLSREAVYLPVHPSMTLQMVREIVAALMSLISAAHGSL